LAGFFAVDEPEGDFFDHGVFEVGGEAFGRLVGGSGGWFASPGEDVAASIYYAGQAGDGGQGVLLPLDRAHSQFLYHFFNRPLNRCLLKPSNPPLVLLWINLCYSLFCEVTLKQATTQPNHSQTRKGPPEHRASAALCESHLASCGQKLAKNH